MHEAGYQFLLSRIGEHLDRIGLSACTRSGLAAPGGAVAVMLPSGGGKSHARAAGAARPRACGCSPRTAR